MKNQWTDGQIEFLKTNLTRYPRHMLSKMLRKDETDVTKKIVELRLNRSVMKMPVRRDRRIKGD